MVTCEEHPFNEGGIRAGQGGSGGTIVGMESELEGVWRWDEGRSWRIGGSSG